MNIFRFILFVIAFCFSFAYWWYCWENGITDFVGHFLDEDGFIAKFLSLLIVAASIGLVIWTFFVLGLDQLCLILGWKQILKQLYKKQSKLELFLNKEIL